MPKVTFNNKNAQFFKSVKKSVDDYFKTNGIKKTGNWKLYLKAYTLFPLALATYIYILLGPYNWLGGIFLSIFLGSVLVCIAFNVMHDACHGSFSGKKWVNELMGYTMNALGSNAFIWKIKHNIIHHTYTNIDGLDDDIAAGKPFLRLSTTQPWKPAHRYQYIYMFPLYAISTLTWMFGKDFYKYFAKKINNTAISKIDFNEHVIFWVSKILYGFFYIVVPVYFVGWQAWLVGFLIVHATMGLTLSIVFQLAHVVEGTAFDVADEDKVIEHEWAVHEIRTTANFAAQNKVISWLFGGLNYQIEHHLFPQISHIHYPAISKIVENQCRQFDLPYNNYPTMREAVVSHIRMMKMLGQHPEQTERAEMA